MEKTKNGRTRTNEGWTRKEPKIDMVKQNKRRETKCAKEKAGKIKIKRASSNLGKSNTLRSFFCVNYLSHAHTQVQYTHSEFHLAHTLRYDCLCGVFVTYI